MYINLRKSTEICLTESYQQRYDTLLTTRSI